MTTIEYVEKAWESYKKNFWQFVIALILQIFIVSIPFLIGVLPWIVILFSTGIKTGIASLLLSNLGVLSFSVVMFLVGISISTVLGGGLVKMAYESLRGKTDYETMFKTAKEKFWTILGANSIVLLTLSIIVAVMLVPIMALSNFSALSAQASFLYIFVIFSTVVLGTMILVIVSILFVFVNQAIVIDRLKALEAVKKSFETAEKNFLSIFFLFLIFFLINSGLENVLSVAGSLIVLFVTAPLALISYTALYIDRRKKH
jgi:MFS family permease